MTQPEIVRIIRWLEFLARYQEETASVSSAPDAASVTAFLAGIRTILEQEAQSA